MYRIFRLPAALGSQVEDLWRDELVGRQSVTPRDAKSLDLPGDDRYVLVEGSDAGIARASELLKDAARPLGRAEEERIYRRFRAQDEDAASGMGLIFGP